MNSTCSKDNAISSGSKENMTSKVPVFCKGGNMNGKSVCSKDGSVNGESVCRKSGNTNGESVAKIKCHNVSDKNSCIKDVNIN